MRKSHIALTKVDVVRDGVYKQRANDKATHPKCGQRQRILAGGAFQWKLPVWVSIRIRQPLASHSAVVSAPHGVP